MATSQKNNTVLRATTVGRKFALVLVLASASANGANDDVPQVEIISVTPETNSPNELVSEWDKPRTPSQLTGQERQAILEQVSGGGSGGIPLLNTMQTSGRTPQVRQLILSVKRPWYVQRAFLSSEGAAFVDARSVMRFDGNSPGRAIVGINLAAGSTYLFDFLVDGEGEGTYLLETGSGTQEIPDPDGERDNVLVALKAEQSGWVELNLRRTAGSFDLHSVEVTLALGPAEEAQEPE